jgi:hypothetical protein
LPPAGEQPEQEKRHAPVRIARPGLPRIGSHQRHDAVRRGRLIATDSSRRPPVGRGRPLPPSPRRSRPALSPAADRCPAGIVGGPS